MPQVSADVHVPIPPDAAEDLVGSQAPVRREWPVFSRFEDGWRLRPEGEGTRVIRRYSYDLVGPVWLRRAGYVLGQWLMGRELQRRVDALALQVRVRADA